MIILDVTSITIINCNDYNVYTDGKDKSPAGSDRRAWLCH